MEGRTMTSNTYPAAGTFAGGGTWNSIARDVVRLAATHGIHLDTESFLMLDVRELRAM
jgi:hypothetical protein